MNRGMIARLMVLCGMVFVSGAGCATGNPDLGLRAATALSQEPMPSWAPGRHQTGLHTCFGQATEDCYGRFTEGPALEACLGEEVSACRQSGGVFLASYVAGDPASFSAQ